MLLRNVLLKSLGTWAVYEQRGGTRKSPGEGMISSFQRTSPDSTGSNPKQRPQESRLPGADPPGDHRQRAAPESQVDALRCHWPNWDNETSGSTADSLFKRSDSFFSG